MTGSNTERDVALEGRVAGPDDLASALCADPPLDEDGGIARDDEDATGSEASANPFVRGVSSLVSRITRTPSEPPALRAVRLAGREALTERLLAQATGNDAFVDMVADNVAPYRRLMAYYRCALMEAETKLRVLNEELALHHDRNPIESIKSRLKSPDSLARKMKLRGYPMTVESIERNVTDVAGLRVVCTFLEDTYELADALLAQDDVVLIERKDYIQNPKESGYRSLHLIIEIPIFLEHEKRSMKVEVQFRTIAENFWATLEHQLRYKKELSRESERYIAAELTDLAETAASLDIRMQALRNYLDEEN